MKRQQGFTLIELLVVIAIIGILSSVVLASLTTARTRGTAASIQSELASARSQAELYYSTIGSNSYVQNRTGTAVPVNTTPCNSTATGYATSVIGGQNGLSTLLTDAAAKGATLTCTASSTAWSVEASYSGNRYCVDSTGKSTSSTTASTLLVSTGVTAGMCL